MGEPPFVRRLPFWEKIPRVIRLGLTLAAIIAGLIVPRVWRWSSGWFWSYARVDSFPRFSPVKATAEKIEDVAVSTQANSLAGPVSVLPGGKWKLRRELDVKDRNAQYCLYHDARKLRCATYFNLAVPNGDGSRLMMSAQTGGGMCCSLRAADTLFLNTDGVMVGSVTWPGMSVAAYAPNVSRLVGLRGDSVEMFDFEGKTLWRRRFSGHVARDIFADKVRIFEDGTKVIAGVDPVWGALPLRGGYVVVMDEKGDIEAKIDDGRETLLSPDRRWMAVGGGSELSVFDFAAKRVVARIAFRGFLGEFRARVAPVAVSSDGKMLLASLRSPPRGFTQSLLVNLESKKLSSIILDSPDRGLPSYSFRSNDVIELGGRGWKKAYRVVLD